MPLFIARWAAIKALFDAEAELSPQQREPLIAAAALEVIDLAELQSLLSHHDASNLNQDIGALGFCRIPQLRFII
jgi:hypothetical protein